ncbi:MAG: ligase-associated DNA damage response exonuclease, partial [Proteobacteria bacterium]
PLLQTRLGIDSKFEVHPYGEKFKIGNATVSFHPAGHILGSSQVRVEYEGKVWVASGDYKRAHDPTCAPFEVVPCDVFITEATFALPIYRWDSGEQTAREVLKWWDENIKENRPSLLFCYALGKTQRLLAEIYQLDPNRQAFLHGAALNLTRQYREAGVEMIATSPVADVPKTEKFGGELILAPPSAFRSLWMKRFKSPSTGFASGWMRVRGARRRKGYDRGFVLSDHADWPGLLSTARDTGAQLILPTHGASETLSRKLIEMGLQAEPLGLTAYENEEQEESRDEKSNAAESDAQKPAEAVAAATDAETAVDSETEANA